MMQTVIDLEREPTNIWGQVFGTDELLLVASGEVVAGFDLFRLPHPLATLPAICQARVQGDLLIPLQPLFGVQISLQLDIEVGI